MNEERPNILNIKIIPYKEMDIKTMKRKIKKLTKDGVESAYRNNIMYYLV